MEKTDQKIRLKRTISTLAFIALAVNLLAISRLNAATETNTAPTTTLNTAENTQNDQESAKTNPCANLRDNYQINDSPLTTVSDHCVTAIITEGTISLDYIPDSFSFPIKRVSEFEQNSFSNDNPTTMDVDISTGPEDLIALHDFRNNGGFSVTITASAFSSATANIPLKNLYIATSYPDHNSLNLLDPGLNGPTNNGITYAEGSHGAQDISAPAFTQGNLNSADNYQTSFDANHDNIADVVELMNTKTNHVGRFSQALNFLLKIPPNQPAGAYQVKFTIDLIY